MSATITRITARLQSTKVTAADNGGHQVTLVNKETKQKTPLVLTHLVDDIHGNSLYYGEFKNPKGFMINKVVVLGPGDKVVAVGSAVNTKNTLIAIAKVAAKKGQYWGDPWYMNVRDTLSLSTGHDLT